jgi:16S rRNA (uracil1498-N3)-methyltransferase
LERACRKREHLVQVAVEALKQSGNAWLPTIAPFTPFRQLLKRCSEFDRVLLATVSGPHERWQELLTPRPKRVLLLIGPEGDFTPEEIRQAQQMGARSVGLGPWVLRTETACTAALAIVQHVLREAKAG